jgi:hypothetical protein
MYSKLEETSAFVFTSSYVLLSDINWTQELGKGMLAVGTGAISVVVAWFIKYFLDKFIKGDHKKKK